MTVTYSPIEGALVPASFNEAFHERNETRLFIRFSTGRLCTGDCYMVTFDFDSIEEMNGFEKAKTFPILYEKP